MGKDFLYVPFVHGLHALKGLTLCRPKPRHGHGHGHGHRHRHRHMAMWEIRAHGSLVVRITMFAFCAQRGSALQTFQAACCFCQALVESERESGMCCLARFVGVCRRGSRVWRVLLKTEVAATSGGALRHAWPLWVSGRVGPTG
jgi:hypothetical protein